MIRCLKKTFAILSLTGPGSRSGDSLVGLALVHAVTL